MTSYSLLFAAFAVLTLPFISAKEAGCETTKPDFKAPGRRISEEKCREYNWLKKKLDKCSDEPVNMEYPYMGALGYKKENQTSWRFLCGTFLISPKFAVTTAICFATKTPYGSPQIARFGNRNIETDAPRVDVKILRSFLHPEFKSPKKAFDIAVVELEDSLVLTKSILPICLWSQSSLPTVEYGNAAGWGAGFKTGFSEVIQVMKVRVLDQESCETSAKKFFNRNWLRVEEHQFCGNESESDVRLCKGSAGIPLVTMGKLDGEDQMPYAFGVISFGQTCPGALGVYTKVSSFIDWIEQTVWPTEKPK